MKTFGLSVLFFLILGVGCTPSPSEKLHSFQGKTMGTTYSVKFVGKASTNLSELQAEVDKALKEVNRQMSTYIKDSEISLLNQAEANAPMVISQWFGETLEVSLKLAQDTRGAFDPTIGPLVNLWGFGPEKHKNPPSAEEIDQVKKFVGFEKVKVSKNDNGQWTVSKQAKPVYVDLSASAKGFGVDVVSQVLAEKGFGNHLVEIGGELVSRGTKFSEPWRVAIEKPETGERSVQEVVQLKDAALATSGNYRNFFKSGGKTYPHSIDRKTGRPVENRLLSVSIIHDDCAKADGLATALMVMGPEKAIEYAKEKNLAALFIVGNEANQPLGAKVIKTKQFKERGSLK